MNRRKFIFYSTAVLLTIPLFRFKNEYFDTDPLSNPKILNYLNQEEIQIIGRNYIAITPQENNAKQLRTLLIGNENKELNFTNSKALERYIQGRIEKDFFDSRTVLCNGWILSITEARQCALFSIT